MLKHVSCKHVIDKVAEVCKMGVRKEVSNGNRSIDTGEAMRTHTHTHSRSLQISLSLYIPLPLSHLFLSPSFIDLRSAMPSLWVACLSCLLLLFSQFWAPGAHCLIHSAGMICLGMSEPVMTHGCTSRAQRQSWNRSRASCEGFLSGCHCRACDTSLNCQEKQTTAKPLKQRSSL